MDPSEPPDEASTSHVKGGFSQIPVIDVVTSMEVENVLNGAPFIPVTFNAVDVTSPSLLSPSTGTNGLTLEEKGSSVATSGNVCETPGGEKGSSTQKTVNLESTELADISLYTESNSTPLPLPTKVKPNKSLGDFSLLTVLGRGAYGKVFLTRHIRSGELLAMKVMRKRELLKRKVVPDIQRER